ncbi:MAG: hypothetical protein GY936_16555 [Ignavibacteriae bacterium]|nr:hypothetical protein [Ignavibacteriota bacterium]
MKRNYIVMVLLLLVASHQIIASQNNQTELLNDFFGKKSVKIVVTDSGLGGVSIAADLASRMEDSGVFENVEVIFFNSQPHAKSGYNSMKTTEQKVEVFNNALYAMEKYFNPDLILIGCNTLSVIYDYTAYSENAKIPVIGIVETGVDLINDRIKDKSNARVFLFATKTTVKQDQHRNDLVKLGNNGESIITKACPKLAGRIERGPDSDTTKSLVNIYVNEILKEYENSDEQIYVSYNCTHYGYVDTLFQEAFHKKNIEVKEFLDPNPFMADFIFVEENINRYENTNVTVRIVSQPELSPGKLGAIYGLIEPISSKTADALFEYEYTPDYFEWESIANGVQVEGQK